MFKIVRNLTDTPIKKKVKPKVVENKSTTKVLPINQEELSKQFKDILSIYADVYTGDVKKFIDNSIITNISVNNTIIKIKTTENYELTVNRITKEVTFKQNERN